MATNDEEHPSRPRAQRRLANERRSTVYEWTNHKPVATVDVICSCGGAIISGASLGAHWEFVKLCEPFVQPVRKIDRKVPSLPNHDLIQIMNIHPKINTFSSVGIFNGTTGGLWGRFGLAGTVSGVWPHEITQPFRAGINGDADDWCVVGQSTIIEHRCRIGPGSKRRSKNPTMIFALPSVVWLGHRIEEAISAGKTTIYLEGIVISDEPTTR